MFVCPRFSVIYGVRGFTKPQKCRKIIFPKFLYNLLEMVQVFPFWQQHSCQSKAPWGQLYSSSLDPIQTKAIPNLPYMTKTNYLGEKKHGVCFTKSKFDFLSLLRNSIRPNKKMYLMFYRYLTNWKGNKGHCILAYF